jgi:hypothetical protein
MPITPVVRYMILCEDWGTDADSPNRVNIYGLLTNIRPIDQPAYPLLFRELCVFLVLTEGRERGDGQIVCVSADTLERVFETPKREIEFGADPLEVVGVPFRIRDCPFPQGGLYLLQFWYNDIEVEHRPLRLR